MESRKQGEDIEGEKWEEYKEEMLQDNRVLVCIGKNLNVSATEFNVKVRLFNRVKRKQR